MIGRPQGGRARPCGEPGRHQAVHNAAGSSSRCQASKWWGSWSAPSWTTSVTRATSRGTRRHPGDAGQAARDRGGRPVPRRQHGEPPAPGLQSDLGALRQCRHGCAQRRVHRRRGARLRSPRPPRRVHARRSRCGRGANPTDLDLVGPDRGSGPQIAHREYKPVATAKVLGCSCGRGGCGREVVDIDVVQGIDWEAAVHVATGKASSDPAGTSGERHSPRHGVQRPSTPRLPHLLDRVLTSMSGSWMQVFAVGWLVVQLAERG